METPGGRLGEAAREQLVGAALRGGVAAQQLGVIGARDQQPPAGPQLGAHVTEEGGGARLAVADVVQRKLAGTHVEAVRARGRRGGAARSASYWRAVHAFP
jgi:hypothetical protein